MRGLRVDLVACQPDEGRQASDEGPWGQVVTLEQAERAPMVQGFQHTQSQVRRYAVWSAWLLVSFPPWSEAHSPSLEVLGICEVAMSRVALPPLRFRRGGDGVVARDLLVSVAGRSRIDELLFVKEHLVRWMS